LFRKTALVQQALREVDEDWNPAWSADWQRHYAAVREMLRDEDQVQLLPGVTVHGMDVGRWLERQRQNTAWTGLMDGQRQRLKAIGVTPLPLEQGEPAKPSEAALGGFERGIAAPGRSTRPAPAL
jgi:hypothetical protein